MVKKRGLLTALTGGIISVLMVGTSLAAPIDLQIGCRPQAMGGAFVAVADDINAGYWNPAGLNLVENKSFGFMHTNPFNISDVSLDYVAFVSPNALSWMKGSLGLSYLKLAAKLEEGKDKHTNPMEDNVYTLSVGGTIWENSLYYGVNAKALGINTEEINRSGMGFDFGLLWKINKTFSLGMMMRNLSSHLGDENFTPERRFGVAGRFSNNRLIVSADYNNKKEVNSKEDYWGSHFGAEGWLTKSLALRVGFDRGNLTAGFGFKFGTGKGFPAGILDYSYAKNEELNYTHRFSLTVLFK